MQSYHLRIKENSLPINVQASITGLPIAVKGVVDTTMRKGNGYTPRQNSGWDTTSQDYRAHLARMERLPTIIPGASQYPTVHKAFNNKYSSEEEFVESKEEHHHKQRSPKSEKKVQVVEHVETIEETRDGNCEVYEETTVDVEAGGYIQQKHKAFELCKWKTFKVH